MALALLDTFDFKESVSDDLELEALFNLDSFDDVPFELLPDDFDFFYLQILAVLFMVLCYQLKHVVILSCLFLNCDEILAPMKQILNSSSLSGQSCFKSSFFS